MLRKVLAQLDQEGVTQPSLETVIGRLEHDVPAVNWRERKGRISNIKSFWKKTHSVRTPSTTTLSPLSTATPSLDLVAAMVQLDTLGRTLGWDQVRQLVNFLEQRK